ncbi:MAG: UDP-glucose/GDP-mannose dehydrogenase family protein [Gammaproteobacteria bacterium]|nr:MAG: UDP-glucose/GDP-mannose dehydrogenase family protein [Gammaproteobacteria bacterium]
MKISVIGTGYVGLVSGACLAAKGHEVTCVDVDQAKVDMINQGRSPIYENGLDELLRAQLGTRLTASTDLAGAVVATDLSLIAVGTPFNGREIDLGFIREVARQIGAALRRKPGYHVVVVKSTVVPGTTDGVVRPILEEASGRQAGRDFGVGMNPEFLTEGEAVGDFMNPDRIVIGGIDARTLDAQAELYAGFSNVPVIRTNNATAEMIKYTANSLLATAISFSNEIANLCTRIGGIDVVDVMAGVHASRYLTAEGKDGGHYRPGIVSFLDAGCGFGGSCLPKDVSALAVHGSQAGTPMPLLEAVLRVNQGRPAQLIELLKKHHPQLEGLRVALLGLAFRPDTNDMRESPAIPVARGLVAEGARVKAYDPAAMDEARRILAGLPIEYAASLAAVVRDVDAIILVTRWDEFLGLPALLQKLPSQPVVVDGRRMLPKHAVARYEGIGL